MILPSILFAGMLVASLAVSTLTLAVCGRLFRAEEAGESEGKITVSRLELAS